MCSPVCHCYSDSHGFFSPRILCCAPVCVTVLVTLLDYYSLRILRILCCAHVRVTVSVTLLGYFSSWTLFCASTCVTVFDDSPGFLFLEESVWCYHACQRFSDSPGIFFLEDAVLRSRVCHHFSAFPGFFYLDDAVFSSSPSPVFRFQCLSPFW